MQELIEKLGIEWQLLLAQAVNFLVILIVLRVTLYKPIVNVLNKRREKIEQGIRDSDSASERLKNADLILAQKMSEADKKSLVVIEAAEKVAEAKESEYINRAKLKEAEILKGAEKKVEQIANDTRAELNKEAASLVSNAIRLIAEKSPDDIDNALVEQAVREAMKIKI